MVTTTADVVVETKPLLLESPTEIDCGEVILGFVLSMSRIF